MTALLASSAAIGATVGILGASPDHQRELGAAIVVGSGAGTTNPPTTDAAPVAGDAAGPQPVGDGLVAPGASWSVALDEVVAQREAEAARLAAEQAAAERAKVTEVKKVVRKPVVRDDDDDDDDDEWDDDEWDDDEWDD